MWLSATSHGIAVNNIGFITTRERKPNYRRSLFCYMKYKEEKRKLSLMYITCKKRSATVSIHKIR